MEVAIFRFFFWGGGGVEGGPLFFSLYATVQVVFPSGSLSLSTLALCFQESRDLHRVKQDRQRKERQE